MMREMVGLIKNFSTEKGIKNRKSEQIMTRRYMMEESERNYIN